MANIVITTTANKVYVDFGIYSTAMIGATKGSYNRSKIAYCLNFTTYIVMYVDGIGEFQLTHDGSVGTMQIDSVDGVTPSSVANLYDLLKVI